FTRAVLLLSPVRTGELRWCALATLASAPGEVEIVDRVFTAVFGGGVDPADFRGDRPEPPLSTVDAKKAVFSVGAEPREPGRVRELAVASAGSAVERLASRDFGDLEPGELALLRDAMRRLRLAPPPRRTRRKRATPAGRRVDLRETLRRSRRSGGEPAVLRRWSPRWKPRKLVVLCDISGSMQAHARAMLQLLVCAAGGTRAEVFTFATRLTRLTRALRAKPALAMRKAGEEAPDWAGGTRIGMALRDFLDGYGARGMARGAVVVIVSDGWETGPAELLGAQMERLSRLAHRIVWVNPRTAKPGYRPLAGGMAAAWPYCDAVVSAHRLDALTPLLDALA
ncbi:VWA domain-containing protein, partial [Amycolatopsis rhizosphaerae]